MKKFLCVGLLIFALILCACGEKNETEAVTKMIDLTDYTANDVIAWANEKVLLTLSSGTRERHISIVLPIPSSSAEDNQIRVYIDDELDRSKTVTLDASVKSKAFTFSGTGTKEIKFKINNEVAAVYEVTFETAEINKIG